MKQDMLDDVKRHLDYVNSTNQKSIRDIEMQEMYFEIERLHSIIKEVREMLYKRDLDSYDTYTANVVLDIQSDFEEIMRGEY